MYVYFLCLGIQYIISNESLAYAGTHMRLDERSPY